jgi:hypothetical protein
MIKLLGCEFQYRGSLNPWDVRTGMGKRLEGEERYAVYLEGEEKVYEIPAELLLENLDRFGGKTGIIAGPIKE